MNSCVLGTVQKESKGNWGHPCLKGVNILFYHQSLGWVNSRVLDYTNLSVGPICIPSVFTVLGMRSHSEVTQLSGKHHHLIRPPVNLKCKEMEKTDHFHQRK